MDASSLEHDRWRGNNSPSLRDGFRRTKYRSRDPVSRRPMARASFFFSGDGSTADISMLPGLGRKMSLRVQQSQQNSSPLFAKSGNSSEYPLADQRKSSVRPMASPLGWSGEVAGPTSINRAPITFKAMTSAAAPSSGSTFEDSTTTVGRSREGSPLLKSLPQSFADAPSSTSGGSAVMATPPPQEVVRLCPTPLAGTRTRTTDPPKDLLPPKPTATFSFPSLTMDPMLRRASTPVPAGKTNIARLMAANRAFVHFEEAPLEEASRHTTRAGSSLQ